jgi:hypothetical protein
VSSYIAILDSDKDIYLEEEEDDEDEEEEEEVKRRVGRVQISYKNHREAVFPLWGTSFAG